MKTIELDKVTYSKTKYGKATETYWVFDRNEIPDHIFKELNLNPVKMTEEDIFRLRLAY